MNCRKLLFAAKAATYNSRHMLALALLCISHTALAQNWIDITDMHIANPNYDGNNYSFWDGTPLSGYNPWDNAEHYERTFDTYQYIYDLEPNSKYRISLDAFYRSGSASSDWNHFRSSNSEDYQYARLYAITNANYFDTGIMLLGNGAVSQSLGGETSSVDGWSKVVPNNMEAAHYWFEAGYYHNTLEFDTDEYGDAYIGIRKDEWVSEDWVCIDTWKLEHFGKLVAPQSITLSSSSLSLTLTEEKYLSADVQPSNTTYRNVTWTSSDESIAIVDATGKVTAVGYGTCQITATTYDGTKSASCSVTVKNSDASADVLVINEIMSANVDMFLDPSFNYGSWIELYNPTNNAVVLGALYVTDDPENLKKHKLPTNYGIVPAKGYRTMWFDHYGIWNEGETKQIAFKLDYDGGTIIISDGTKILVQQDYPEAISRTSYARTKDGGSEWGIATIPTPGKTNAGCTFAAEQIEAPVVDTDGQVFEGSLTIKVTKPANTTLYYTTDGSVPTKSNGNTSSTGRFSITKSAVYRFRLFKDGMIPSNVVTRSYIKKDRDLLFPIISVVTDQDNIYSNEIGLFQRGPNGRAGNGQDDRCNWNMDWDRPVNFEYITADGDYALSQEVDMSMCGGWSRAWTPHSFKLKAAKYYMGKNSMDCQFFADKPYLKHKVLQIRNGGNDTGNRIKDAALQEIARRSGLYVDGQAWQPVHVYINGKFYDNLNMREPNNKDFANANYGIDADYMDQFEMSPDSGYVQMRGTKESFNRLYNLSKNATDKSSYQEICKLLDIDEFLNYMAVELYLGNWDWPQNNVKGFRDQNDGKFHFVLFDLDGSLSTDTPLDTFFGKKNYSFDGLRGEDAFGNSLWGTGKREEIQLVTIFENLLRNDTFRKKFIDTFCIVAGSVFDPEFSKNIIREMAAYNEVGGIWSWNTANEIISNLSWRQYGMVNHLRNHKSMNLSSDPVEAAISSNAEGAKILINDMIVPTGKFAGRLFAPATIKAVAPAGYKFVGWSVSAAGSSGTALFESGSNWKYYDKGSLDGKGWQKSAYSDTSWKSGKSPIGYGKNQNTVTESYRPTYYFRKTITLDDAPGSADVFTLDYTLDDGMILYVNGTEVARDNMPSGNVTYDSYASTYANDNPNHGSLTIPAARFVKGSNTIAVEVHNNSSSSSDILWDATLYHKSMTDGTQFDIIDTNDEYALPKSGKISLTAVFEPVSSPTILIANGTMPVKINEVSAANDIYVNDHFKKDDWFELYNTTDEPIDIAGMYISDNPANPQKFQVPASDNLNTIIQPHSHLVLWASKRDMTGSHIYTGFKLGNNDGEQIILTSENGEWSDTLTYIEHGAKETVGLFPDGGNKVYRMGHPTVGNANEINSNSEYLYTYVYNKEDKPQTFTLDLAQGWNWISHPLTRSIDISEVNANATQILSQTASATKDATLGWTGTLASLLSSEGYKINMSLDTECTFNGQFLADDAAITLKKGWNWISYPRLGTQPLSSALSAFQASEGDIIVGQEGFATYENGAWSGSLETLDSGSGYIYYSSVPSAITFAPADKHAHPRAAFRAQPRRVWNANSTSHPDVMGIVASITVNGVPDNSATYSIGAFSDDGECRGVGKYIDGKLFLTVYGEGSEHITFKASDASGIVYDIKESYTFASDVHGSRKSPVTLTIGAATDIATLKTNPSVEHAAYYTLNGISAGTSKQSLAQGIYIAKYTLLDGNVITKKIIIK